MNKIICFVMMVAVIVSTMTACSDEIILEVTAPEFRSSGDFLITEKDESAGTLTVANNDVQMTIQATNGDVREYNIGDTLSGAFIRYENEDCCTGGDLCGFDLVYAIVFSDY